MHGDIAEGIPEPLKRQLGERISIDGLAQVLARFPSLPRQGVGRIHAGLCLLLLPAP